MSYIQIERLKKDRNEALYYQKKLMKKGKDVLAYKMEKKIAHLIDEPGSGVAAARTRGRGRQQTRLGGLSAEIETLRQRWIRFGFLDLLA